MQAIMETLFDVVYLLTVITLGVKMIKKANGNSQIRSFGFMAVLLGCGDAFHLVPRSYALLTSGLEANAAALGVGKFITSITMTIFYVILYKILVERYSLKNTKNLSIAIYALAAIRIILCLLPQNEWLSYYAPLSFGIYRNIPFAIMGIMLIVLFYKYAKQQNDKAFKYMWLAITLSFAFYVPVVLFSDVMPIIGILMIPKTLAYVWVVLMGYSELKK